MFFPIIGPRLHGWLDELVAISYIVGVLALRPSLLVMVVLLIGAAIHFTITRVTNYPQGTWKVISFRTHAFIELGEGIFVLIAGSLAAMDAPALTRVFVAVMGASQLGAFALSDYGPARAEG
jgi:hypothetical protein